VQQKTARLIAKDISIAQIAGVLQVPVLKATSKECKIRSRAKLCFNNMQGTSRFFWGCLSSEGCQDLMIERG